MKTAFDILEVSAQASDEEVKTAYLQKVRQYTPERDPKQFQTIRAAFEAIQTKPQRLSYQLFHYEPLNVNVLLERALKSGTSQRPSESLFLQTLAASLTRIPPHG